MTTKEKLSESIIKAPHELGSLGYNASKKASEAKNTGIPLPLDVVNGNGHNLQDYFAPLLNWEICAIQAQTSNGKTMFKDWWLERTVDLFKEKKRDQIIIDIHLEESLEQVAFHEFSKRSGVNSAEFARGDYLDFGNLQAMMTEISGVPIWHIGVSADDPPDTPDLTLSNIYRAIMALKDGKITREKWDIGLTSVDYLQVLPFDSEVTTQQMDKRRRLQVARDVNLLRKMTIKVGCPFLVPLQAKQEIQVTEPYHIPQMYDGSETMSIATRFDRLISLWMPSSTHPNSLHGEIVGKKDVVPVFPNNMYLQVIKQRGGLPKGEKWHLGWNFKTYDVKGIYAT